VQHANRDDANELVRHWREAVARRDIAAALELAYAGVAAEIAQRGPTCWTSGKCCNFEAYGHGLYVTGLEAAYTTRSAAELLNPPGHSPGAVRLPILADAPRAPGCPFQRDKLCGVHAVRPLGCRVYYCDPSAQHWQGDLTERALTRIRGIHDHFGVTYLYGEWRAMLAMFAAAEEAPGPAYATT
jgi:hypothetical protein